MKLLLKAKRAPLVKQVEDLRSKVLEMRMDLHQYAEELQGLNKLVHKKLQDDPDLKAYDEKMADLRRKYFETLRV